MQLSEFPFNEDMNSGNPIGIGASSLAYIHSSKVNITLARLDPVLDWRWQEEQCLSFVPHTGALQVELRYLGQHPSDKGGPNGHSA